jgi:Tfp pilus assembly major pilin PilA
MKNKGFTILETAIVILLITVIITTLSNIYINLVRTVILANDYYQSLENVRLGTEKLWRLLKDGWNFEIESNQQGISFQKHNCVNAQIKFQNNNLEYCEGDSCNFQSVFDENLVKVIDFKVATDTPYNGQTSYYFQYAPKIIILYYNLELKSRKKSTTTLEFQQAVAPLNSVYTASLCE